MVLVLGPVVIPQVDGGEYPDSVPVLQIFLATALGAYLTAPSVSILMAQRRYGFLAGVYIAGLLVNLVGDVAVAPRFGVVGMALVSSAVYVAIDVTLTTKAPVKYERRIELRYIFQHPL
jgi:O-antigen/teichoic acid export membrane protein